MRNRNLRRRKNKKGEKHKKKIYLDKTEKCYHDEHKEHEINKYIYISFINPSLNIEIWYTKRHFQSLRSSPYTMQREKFEP